MHALEVLRKYNPELFNQAPLKEKVYTNEFKGKIVSAANLVGNTVLAKETGISASTISNWKRLFPMPEAPIQDENGNLKFTIDGKEYSINVNWDGNWSSFDEGEREEILREINRNSEHHWDWFKEHTGKGHWVLYDTQMYYQSCTCDEGGGSYDCLQYRISCGLPPVIPINATSCAGMFDEYKELTFLNLLQLNTCNVTSMENMFKCCEKLHWLDVSRLDTSKVKTMYSMFFAVNL